MNLIPLLKTVVEYGIIFYVIYWLLGYFKAPEPIVKVYIVLVVLVVVIWLLQTFLQGAPAHPIW